jgi:hypothetical protein
VPHEGLRIRPVFGCIRNKNLLHRHALPEIIRQRENRGSKLE